MHRNDRPLWGLSAEALARAVGARDVAVVDVVEAHLARIEAVNGAVNAVTRLLADEALTAARAADRRLAAGEPARPLEGVPFSVKENLDVEASATTHGVPALAAAVAPHDAPIVAHLRRAGAIPVARTNMPDFAMRWHTDSFLHGPTLDPRDPTRTPGGSSGGDAVAVATGMVPLGLGTDLGGSLRWPAQCQGIATIRPSLARVPHAPALEPRDEPLTLHLMDSRGPLVRHAADLRLVLEVMVAPDARDPWHIPLPLDEPEARLAVAVVPDPAGGGTDPRIAAAVRRAADLLADAGWRVAEAEPPGIRRAAELWQELLGYDTRPAWPALRPMVSEDAARVAMLVLEGLSPPIDAVGFAAGLVERQRIARAWSMFMDRFPLILGPVATIPAFRVGDDLVAGEIPRIADGFRFVLPVNVLGLPAAVVPLDAEGATGAARPVVQLIGRRFREADCLRAAELLEAASGAPAPVDPVGRR